MAKKKESKGKASGFWAIQWVAPPGTRGSEKPGHDHVHAWTRSSPGVDDVTFIGKR